MVSSMKDVIIRVTLLTYVQLAVCTYDTEYKCHKIIMTSKKVNNSQKVSTSLYAQKLQNPKIFRMHYQKFKIILL